jgi:PAS domain S-box-containing protein
LREERWGGWGFGVVLWVLYVGVGLLSIRLAMMGELVAMVWLPAGVGLAGLMLGGVRVLPWVWAGAWAINFVTAWDFELAVLLGVGNCLGPCVGWLLLRRVGGEGVSRFVLFGGVLGPLVSAVWGVGVLFGMGEIGVGEGVRAFFVWWLGDGCGVLVAAPVLLNVGRARREVGGRWAEVGALAVVGGAIGGVLVGVVWAGLVPANGALMCVFLPLLVWAALRLGVWMSSVVVGVVVVGALVSVAVRLPEIQIQYVMLEMWLYTSVMGITSLMLGALHVTKRKTEDALKGSEAQLNQALSAASMGQWSWDIHTGSVVWSSQADKLFGTKRGEVAGVFRAQSFEGYMGLVHPEDVEGVLEQIWGHVDKKGQDFVLEHRIVWPDGSVHWVEGRGTTLFDKGGNPVRMSGTVLDITERKRAEEARLRTQRLLEAIHQVQSRFISETNAGDTFQELLGVLLEITGSAYGFIGEVAQENHRPEGETPWRLKPLAMSEFAWGEAGGPEERPAGGMERVNFHSLLGRTLRDGGVVIWDAQKEDGAQSMKLPGGHPPLRAFLGMALHLDGQLVGMVGVANRVGGYQAEMVGELKPLLGACASVIAAYRNDLRRREAQEARLQMQHKLQEAQRLESLGVLAGGIAHDFNNLLTGIMGNASMITSAQAEDVPALVDDVLAASQRAADLCRQMLAYSGRGKFVVKPLDLSELVREMLQLIRSSVSRKAELHMDLAQGLTRVIADTAQLQQIVMNLVINASEALSGHPGEIWLETGEVMVSARELADGLWGGGDGVAGGVNVGGVEEPAAGRYVYFEVRDTGCGMDAQTKTRIFDPFFTTKFHGRGLGLAAVQGIVRGHRGVLQVESALGQGSTFRLLLPAVVDVVRSGVPGILGGTADATSFYHRKETGHGDVLVVDDDAGVRTLAQGVLSRIGFRVHSAEDGEQALEMCERMGGRLRFVLLDLTMPRLDGRETLAHLKRSFPKLKVILMSGFSDEEERQVGGGGEAPEAFLSKPFTVNALLACLGRLRVFG